MAKKCDHLKTIGGFVPSREKIREYSALPNLYAEASGICFQAERLFEVCFCVCTVRDSVVELKLESEGTQGTLAWGGHPS